MKFSVLIAHYNNAEYFKECYQSILHQTYTDWEIVILDDASRPEELQQVKALVAENPKVKIHTHASNQGVGVTKSTLIELATGDICGFVDPDDALTPTAIESAITLFKKKKKTVLTYSRFMTCDANLQPLQPFSSAQQVINNSKYFFNFPVQIAHFVCFRKSVYLTTEKMDPCLKIAEDQDLYLKMYEKGEVTFIDETNYLYRTHDKGISQNDNKKKSYEYWGKVLWLAMKRRQLTHINGKKIPKEYTSSEEIFQLLDYQNQVIFRIKKKFTILLQQLLA